MNKIWLIPVFIVTVLLIFMGWIVVQHRAQSYMPLGGQAKLPMRAITIGRTSLFAEVASTDAQMVSGLSGRESLSEESGMLFVFDAPHISGFWMKDMKFSIDIVWADASGTIVTVYQDLPPTSYPNIFKPISPAQYVLEVPAGFVAKHQIVVGDKIVL